jgi:hypothetical protein
VCLAPLFSSVVAETIMYMEREQQAGPDYHPTSLGLRKWASQPGSIDVGDRKLRVAHPRLRGRDGERTLRSYEQLKQRGGFSEELLAEVLRGLSARKYEETVTAAGQPFGVSASAVSRHLVEATAKKLREFRERRLEDFHVFARCLDTIHRGGQAFIVALGIDLSGTKPPWASGKAPRRIMRSVAIKCAWHRYSFHTGGRFAISTKNGIDSGTGQGC